MVHELLELFVVVLFVIGCGESLWEVLAPHCLQFFTLCSGWYIVWSILTARCSLESCDCGNCLVSLVCVDGDGDWSVSW